MSCRRDCVSLTAPVVSALTLFRDFPAILCYDKGQARVHSHYQRLDHLSLLSIDAWTVVTLGGNVFRSSPWIQRPPSFTQKGRKQKKTLYDRHDRVLLPPAPETGPSPLQRKTYPTSFFPRQEGGPDCGTPSVYPLWLFSICLRLPHRLYTFPLFTPWRCAPSN